MEVLNGCRSWIGVNPLQFGRYSVTLEQERKLDEVIKAHESWGGLIRHINRMRRQEQEFAKRRKGWIA